MSKRESLRTKHPHQGTYLAAALLLVFSLASANSHAQAAAEAAAATAASGAMSAGVAARAVGGSAASAMSAGSGNLQAAPVPMGVREGPAVEEANRKAFEQRAGKDAAKLLLRSEPMHALIYIDGKSVGLTPLLLILPAGKFQVEMRGPQQQFGAGDVELAPNETRQYLVPLTQRFASNVTARPNSASSITVNFDKSANKAAVPPIGSVQNGPALAPELVSPAASASPSEESNRKRLENQAGNDAGKLAIKSDPDDAQVYVSGIDVGRTPLELHLAPGRYQIIIRGKDGESGERFVGLLPNETQQVTVPLTTLYPGKVAVQWPRSSAGSH